MEQYQEILSLAVTLARDVGARMRETTASPEAFSITHKGRVDLVTEVDLWSERHITDGVRRVYPLHIVIGEETYLELEKTEKKTLSEIGAKGFCWIVDPVDGTTNFSNKLPHSVVSIGILHEGIRAIGVVYDPFRDEMFTAVKGQGAFLNDKPISVTKKEIVGDAVVATGFPYDRDIEWPKYLALSKHLMTHCRALRVFGAAALDQAWVACGRLDAFCEYGLKPWDIAAGSLIVEEAGGRSGQFIKPLGEPMTVFGSSYVFSNSHIFEALHNICEKATDFVLTEKLA